MASMPHSLAAAKSVPPGAEAKSMMTASLRIDATMPRVSTIAGTVLNTQSAVANASGPSNQETGVTPISSARAN
jgi:hypothetical protein